VVARPVDPGQGHGRGHGPAGALLQLAASPATAAVPVVVLSGDSGQAMVKDLLAAGASGFLAKPFAVGELLAIIARHLG
jgi:CheY-like chemotaxis protein